MEQPSNGALITPEVARAEELVDELTQNVSTWARQAGLEILKRAALAREEAEDIWAEARALSRDES
jgi:hypothetical protein